MCGIFGYTGKRNALKICIEGLKHLEYRGYDSAGIAVLQDNQLIVTKQEGRVEALRQTIENTNIEGHVALAHTRWATHGPPSQRNAHPHLDSQQRLALVHNGIIENHQALRPALIEAGVQFISDTDTEVVCHLIAQHYHGDLLKTLQIVLQLLQGSFAFALLHCDYPGQIIACTHHAPLIIGLGEDEMFLSSDTQAFTSHTRHAVYLNDGEIAVLQPGKLELFNRALSPIPYTTTKLNHEHNATSKGLYEHFTRKEIDEQPQTLRQALHNRYSLDYGTAHFEELMITDSDLLAVQRILIIACGTSWNAGYLGTYLCEDLARIPAQVEIASEFRYKNPVVPPGTLAIAISQSGETADTLAAVKELKTKGVPILALCNVPGSSLTRVADSTLMLRAGPEIGVCSTKAFTSQVAVLTLFILKMARMRNLSKSEGQSFLYQLEQLPALAESVLALSPVIEQLAIKYADYTSFFFLGRRYMYPTSLEGALKLKEISYINANAYPAGEMKHGPIALIDPSCPTLALCNNAQTFDKILSNLMEIKARRGPVLAFAQSGCEHLEGVADDIVYLPNTIDELAAILAAIATQLFAYYIAKKRGVDIDQPRNLAKSVTVE